MSNIFAKNAAFLVSLVAIAIASNGASAQAETINTESSESPVISVSQMSSLTETTNVASATSSASQTPSGLVAAPVIDSLASDAQSNLQPAIPADANTAGVGSNVQQLQTPTQEAAIASGIASPTATSSPVPGTTATSAASLTTAPPAPQQAPATTTNTDEVAQVDVDPGTPTFGGDSYIGIAGNLGLGGDSALGDSSFMVISKIGLTTRIAVRPSVAIENDPVVLVPVTFDFSIRPVDAFTERLPIAPYVGGGIAFSTGDDSDVGPLITAGVDFPVTPRFTATAAVNAAFLDDTDVGILVGIGYNFSALGI